MRYPGQCPPFVFCSFCLSGAPTLLFVHCVLTYRNKKTTKGQREKKKKKIVTYTSVALRSLRSDRYVHIGCVAFVAYRS